MLGVPCAGPLGLDHLLVVIQPVHSNIRLRVLLTASREVFPVPSSAL